MCGSDFTGLAVKVVGFEVAFERTSPSTSEKAFSEPSCPSGDLMKNPVEETARAVVPQERGGLESGGRSYMRGRVCVRAVPAQ